MIVIELQFPAGRFHATPWGRNVNEGEVEWPPSPYRLARALVDVWKRRKPAWPEERMEPVLKALNVPPKYLLPAAAAAHTRSYLSSNTKDPTDKQLIFDAFVVIDRCEKVLMGFEGDLSPESRRDLQELLEEINYFGRSESWVRAGLADGLSDIEWNCFPTGLESAGPDHETVQVACLLPPERYAELPHRPEKKEKKQVKTGKACSWIEALCMTTKDLLKEGWSNPPALFRVDYARRSDSLRPRPGRSAPGLKGGFRCAKYALCSTVLPNVEETASFAERIRGKLMGIHKRIKNNDPALVSPVFSGKDPEGRPLKGHRHAFFLPLDEDGDGRLDHLLIYAADPFDEGELAALDNLRSVWQSNRRPDVRLVLVSLSAELPGQKSVKKWVSASPFVSSRHYRKGRGTYQEWLDAEIMKECTFHGLPEPVGIEWISHPLTTTRQIRWFEFIRSRKDVRPFRGYGCILEFNESVRGPFALGSGCHFGLGLFVRYNG